MKKLLSLILALSMLLLCVGSLASCELFGGSKEDEKKDSGFDDGKGTEDDPYEISSAKELKNLSKKLNDAEYYAEYCDKYYVLTKDIDLDGAEWTPIGGDSYNNRFAGVFDGQGYTVSNFNITKVSEEGYAVGLFGTVSGTVKNLNVSNFNISINPSKGVKVGGIVGELCGEGSAMYGCSAYSAQINVVTERNATVGGIVGNAYMAALKNCRSEVNINAESKLEMGDMEALGVTCGAFAGGIGDSTVITDCSVYATVSATSNTHGASAGLFVGGINKSELSGCFAEGTVTVTCSNYDENQGYRSGYVGGIAGEALWDAVIKKCAFNGTVQARGKGNFYLGGLAGKLDGIIENSYASGFADLKAYGIYTNYNANGSYVGGLVGIADVAEIKNSYASNRITARYTDNTLRVGGLVGGCISNTNCSISLYNCFSVKDIDVEVTSYIDNAYLHIGYCAGDASFVNTEGCYRYYLQWVRAVYNSVHQYPTDEESIKEAEKSFVNSPYFYMETLGWDESVWDFSSLDAVSQKFPVLHASKTIVD